MSQDRLKQYCSTCGKELVIKREGRLVYFDDEPNLPWYRRNTYQCPDRTFWNFGHHSSTTNADLTSEFIIFRDNYDKKRNVLTPPLPHVPLERR